ncbi:glycerophosphodiester phosphodiesterase family protein [uncultured Paraglaciecola sp.]|uniref:glycerophosphodiester phosphodiesterase n=1 Tax=uncultured Paraglaciecola sp. TaxID=1765024 RepID=UPI00261403B7|nr:glycerophosphodiester phosphodiesterase family protein [uncultured Paraglaciecola sp.]
MLIIAHRGASADAPENTLVAIEQALAQQADGIEIDVYQLDSDLVVIHDKWVNRTTNGEGSLSDYTLATLQKLDAGQGQSVPTLWQVLNCIQGQCIVNIELKGVDDVSLVYTCISDAVSRLNFKLEQFIVSSFNHHLLLAFKEIAPSIKIGALTGSNPIDRARFAEQLGAFSVNVDGSFIDQAFVEDAHCRGLKIFAYTVDEAEDLIKLQTWGVDGVFSNGPAKAKAVLTNKDTKS